MFVRRLSALALAVALAHSADPNSAAYADRPEARELFGRGQSLQEQGAREEALQHFEKAIRSDIDYIPAYEAALPLWMALGKWQEARTQLEALTLRCQDCAFAWYALGALYRKGGRFDLAALAYDAYLAKRPGDADAHFGLAMALAASKDDRARGELSRYLRLEDRAERSVYRERALMMLRELGQTPDPRPEEPSISTIPAVAALIQARRYASAESLLNASGRTDEEALTWRLVIAEGRGQWFQALGYRGLLLIYQL